MLPTILSLVDGTWQGSGSDQRRTRGKLEEVYPQVDAPAVAIDRQGLTQDQLND